MQLVKPDKKYYESYVEAAEEYRIHKVQIFPFLDTESMDIFETIKNYEAGVHLPAGWVPATYFWMVDENEFLGEICIRHELTEALLKFGGHIGYGVRYSKWNQGIGTEMLKRTLPYVREVLHLDKVLLTCNDDNCGSFHVIERNGGILWDKIENVIDGEKRLTRRYWITLDNYLCKVQEQGA